MKRKRKKEKVKKDNSHSKNIKKKSNLVFLIPIWMNQVRLRSFKPFMTAILTDETGWPQGRKQAGGKNSLLSWLIALANRLGGRKQAGRQGW